MKLKEILGKILSGGQLVPEEKAFLESLPEENDKEKVLSEMQARLESIEQKDVPPEELARKRREKEIEELRRQVELLSNEKESAFKELDNLKFNSRVHELAVQGRFTDANYLGYLLRSDNIDVSDQEKTAAYVNSLRESKPELFKADIAPGAGSMPDRGGANAGSGSAFQTARGSGSLSEMLKHAPTERLDA